MVDLSAMTLTACGRSVRSEAERTGHVSVNAADFEGGVWKPPAEARRKRQWCQVSEPKRATLLTNECISAELAAAHSEPWGEEIALPRNRRKRVSRSMGLSFETHEEVTMRE